MRILLWVFLVLLFQVTASFAEKPSAPPTASESAEFHDPFAAPEGDPIEDPLEDVNRAFFGFNDLLYTKVLAPICRAIPAKMHENLLATLSAFGQPLQVGQAELRFAFRDAGSETGRLVMHAALSLLHYFEPATTEGLRNGEEDFGQVLQALGFDPGIYLVLPIFGPSSMRDGIGRITSFYLDPSPDLCNPDVRRTVAADPSLAGTLAAYEEIRRQTLDPYLFLRDAYSQQLASAERKVQNLTRTPASDAPEKKNVRHAALL